METTNRAKDSSINKVRIYVSDNIIIKTMYALTKSGITILTKEKSGTCFLIVWHDTKTAVNTVRTFKRYGIQYGASILNAMYVRGSTERYKEPDNKL